MRPKVRGYLPELDGLRGIAILLVMIHRMYPGTSPWYIEAGWIGVDLFFVVSGFLIAGILLDTRHERGYFRNFYARRVLRIFPLYYLLIGGILVAFPLGNPDFLETSGSRAWYLFHLGNVPEAVLELGPPYWLAPVWSLAIEEQFYLTFPLLVRWSTPRRLAGILIAMAVIAIATRVISTFAMPANERFQYQFTLCRLDAIAAGCALALLVRWREFARWYPRMKPWLSIGMAACAGLALGTQLDRTTTFGRTVGYSIVALGFGALVLRVAMARDVRSTAMLRWAPLRYLGKLCFGLYLLHRPADTLTSVVIAKLGFDGESMLWLPLKMVVAVGLATLSWNLLEQPFLRLKDRFASRKHPSAHSTGRLLAVGLLIAVAGCGHPASATPGDGPREDSPSPIDGRSDDATDAPPTDASQDRDAPDAPPDAPPAPAGHVLYPENRVHSPVTSDIVASIHAIATSQNRWRDVFDKVGDSITATTDFLVCFGGTYDLGANGYLAPTLAQFLAGNAAGTTPFERTSLSATGGWTTRDVLSGSPSWLDREVDAISPRFAVVMLGTNDVRYGRTIWDFAEDLWTLIDRLRARGVVPILSTIPGASYAADDARTPLFNYMIRAIAQGRQLPLIDYHLALATLPGRGISSDGIHPSVSPDGPCKLTAAGLAYGYNMRNLVTLAALDRALRAFDGQPSDASAPVRQGAGTHADPVEGTLPLVDLGDTRTGESVFGDYLPCDRHATGRERVYRLDLPRATTIDAYVADRGADVEVEILDASLSETTCVAAGDRSATTTVGPGTIYIVVDSRTPATEGEFLLVVHEP